jgi:hypothetical protein
MYEDERFLKTLIRRVEQSILIREDWIRTCYKIVKQGIYIALSLMGTII